MTCPISKNRIAALSLAINAFAAVFMEQVFLDLVPEKGTLLIFRALDLRSGHLLDTTHLRWVPGGELDPNLRYGHNPNQLPHLGYDGIDLVPQRGVENLIGIVFPFPAGLFVLALPADRGSAVPHFLQTFAAVLAFDLLPDLGRMVHAAN